MRNLNQSLKLKSKWSDFWVRREGLANHYLAGQSPPLTDEPNTETLDVDYTYFDNIVWPNIANRVPGFENIKVSFPKVW